MPSNALIVGVDVVRANITTPFKYEASCDNYVNGALSVQAVLSIFNTNVKSVLLCGSETWSRSNQDNNQKTLNIYTQDVMGT